MIAPLSLSPSARQAGLLLAAAFLTFAVGAACMHSYTVFLVAFIEAFRRWGIYPDGVRGMSESDLRYPHPDQPRADPRTADWPYDQTQTKEIFKRWRKEEVHLDPDLAPPDLDVVSVDWNLDSDRRQLWGAMNRNAAIFHAWLTGPGMWNQLPGFGLTLGFAGMFLAAIVLVPMAGIANVTAVDMCGRHMPWAVVIVVLLPALIGFYAFWARLRFKSAPPDERTSTWVWGSVFLISALTFVIAAY